VVSNNKYSLILPTDLPPVSLHMIDFEERKQSSKIQNPFSKSMEKFETAQGGQR
jgi:hypothetical protein